MAYCKARVPEAEKRSILRNFKFDDGELPVRYLGLPLMTQRMKKQDYTPLLEKIRAFLWTGPILKSTNAKVAWTEVWFPKREGGLGIRSLKEVNKVYGLKLIWRMLTGSSLWGKWIRVNLLKGRSFWEVNLKMQTGSWMWHKMLKLRSVAKLFYKVEVGNGRHTSFWYDNWSRQGVLVDLLGARGFIDMGVRKNATVEDAVLYGRRRRRHRLSILNDIEDKLDTIRSNPSLEGIDRSLWRRDSAYNWAPGIWFSQATPKFAFMAGLSVRDRMSTMDRVVKWSRGSNDMCVLCHNAQESRNHLFFECDLSAQ
ncbi:PREDICTED: uncharacterized protein LOC106321329, partial [Brassica oleracea var. oleracea]|uniref:uncharacterized protein LOC106321329 n=1 Tax=Brassica oleracea var. oleracea TaxID=109376 RepID=UPI0006A6CD5B